MNLTGPNPIVANGVYYSEVIPGQPYIFTLKDTFGGATVVMAIRSLVDNLSYDNVDGGSWTAPAEDTLIPDGKLVRFTVTGGTGISIRVNLTPILQS
jgi:hypothetical protein